MFKSRECNLNEVPDDAIHLFYTNEEVDQYNNFKINNSPLQKFQSIAIDKINGKLPEKQKENTINLLKKLKTSDTYGLPYELALKINIR